MKRTDVDKFEKLKAQLDSLYAEISILAKKTPNGPTNAFKIKLVNVTLGQCNEFFGISYRPFVDFENFDVDDLPTASDVTFILSQYIECAEKLRADNVVYTRGQWWWEVEGEREPTIRTAIPEKLMKKK